MQVEMVLLNFVFQALQSDISTVQKKVDSLIETCTYMMNRSEPEYADYLKEKLNDMNRRWELIVLKTEKEKNNLLTGLDKFRQVDAGIKEIVAYLTTIENMMQAEQLDSLDVKTVQARLDQYKVSLKSWLPFVAFLLLISI